MSHSAAPPEPPASSSPSTTLHPVGDSRARTLQEALDLQPPESHLALYQQAIAALVRWQVTTQAGALPVRDPAQLRQELDGFAKGYLRQYRGLAIDKAMDQRLSTVFERLVQHNLSWPSVAVHGNFTPRAVGLATEGVRPAAGILEVQGSHQGPITCDIATLVRDGAPPSWDEAFAIDITVRYWQAARAAGLPVGDDFGAFYQGVEWMALQRHLQVLGACAQQYLHDGHAEHLADSPHRIHQVRAIAGRYIELKPLLRGVDAAEGITDAAGFAFGRV